MKKFISLICMIAIFFAMTANLTLADDDIKVYLNGEQIEFEDQQPVIIDGRTLVPLRGVFEAMGMDVVWKEKLVDINYKNMGGIRIFIGSTSISTHLLDENGAGRMVNSSIPLDVPAQIINDRTMIPLRVVSETLGTTVDWDATKKRVDMSCEQSVGEDFIEKLKQAEYEKNKYYQNTDILNFRYYIGDIPLMAETGILNNDYYLYDYTNFVGDIDNVIEEYIDDVNETLGYTLEGSSETGNENMQVRLVKDDEDIDIVIIKVPSTKKIMIILETQSGISPVNNEAYDEIFDVLYHGGDNQNNSSGSTSKEINNTKTENNKTNGDFTYLKDMSYTNLYKDATESYVQSKYSDTVYFHMSTDFRKNSPLEKGDECSISVEYDLNGNYSRLTSTLKNGGASVRIYCDGKLVHTTPRVVGAVDLDLDVSGCQTLKIEVFATVAGIGTTKALNMREAKLWY